MSKKKITDPKGSMEELITRAVEAAKAPFTPDRKAELPSLRSVAEQLGTTVIRTRKLLITANYFTSPTATAVHRMKAEGKSIEEIGATLRLKPAAVYGYLPYDNLAYNLPVGIPLWIAAMGSAIAIVIVKQLFGGLDGDLVLVWNILIRSAAEAARAVGIMQGTACRDTAMNCGL